MRVMPRRLTVQCHSAICRAEGALRARYWAGLWGGGGSTTRLGGIVKRHELPVV